MGLPARSPLDSFVVATLGDEADDVYFIKLAPWRTKAWRLGRMPLPCRGRWRHGVRQDDANVNIINPVSQGS